MGYAQRAQVGFRDYKQIQEVEKISMDGVILERSSVSWDR